MEIEGLILKKQVIKDHDLLVSVLARDGKNYSIYCYGAQSSRKGKASILELGMMNRYNLRKRGDSYSLINVESIWLHDKIRFDFLLFSALAFMCEVVLKIAPPGNEDSHSESVELFSIMSNAIFHLNQCNTKDLSNLLALFVIKITKFQGIMFNVTQCIYSDRESTSKDKVILSFSGGGFGLTEYGDKELANYDNDIELWKISKILVATNFKDLPLSFTISTIQFNKLFSFLCFQLNFIVEQFNTFKLLNKCFKN